jgi:hypothetical protein
MTIPRGAQPPERLPASPQSVLPSASFHSKYVKTWLQYQSVLLFEADRFLPPINIHVDENPFPALTTFVSDL